MLCESVTASLRSFRPFLPIGRPDGLREEDLQSGIHPAHGGQTAGKVEGARSESIKDPEPHILINWGSRNIVPAVHGRPPRGGEHPPGWQRLPHGAVPVIFMRKTARKR